MADDQQEVMAMSSANQDRIAQQQALQRNYEMRVKGQQLPLPTNDIVVQARLLQLKQMPVASPDEIPGERRERLREVVVEYFVQFQHSPGDDVFKNPVLDFEERLGRSLTPLELQALKDAKIKTGEDEKMSDDFASGDEQEMFYTEGGSDLKEARTQFAYYSLPRATKRL